MFDPTANHPGNALDLGQIVGRRDHLWLDPASRGRHLYVAGLTGTGKSKFLEGLIRQDILNWDRTECGMLVLDPHGALVHNVLSWLADPRYQLDRPVVPIRPHRSEWVVGYNPLRQREASPSVVVSNVAHAMAHVWGEEGTQATPRFAQWIANVLHTLYASGYTLAEALRLLDREQPEVRRLLQSQVDLEAVQRGWNLADALSAKEFEGYVESTVNRLRAFEESEALHCAFGQTRSLDLGRAMAEGWIVLADLSPEGGTISEEHTRLFGTLLLSDLWMAGRERGKADEGRVKPFYIYADELQEFISPTLAKNLDQARGYGLHFTMANQYPEQLSDRSEEGRKLYHSVMNNAANKVVFRTQHEESLRPLASWLFMGALDPDQIKHQLYSRKVMDYREEYRTAYGEGQSVAQGAGASWSRSEGEGASASQSMATGASEAIRTDPPPDHLLSPLVPALGDDPGPRDVTHTDSQSQVEVDSSNRYFAETHGGHETWSESHSRSRTQTPMLIPVMGDELAHVQFRTIEEQLFRAMAALFDLSQRQCVIRLAGMSIPASVFTRTVAPSLAENQWVEEYVDDQLRTWPFALPWPEAQRHVQQRKESLRAKAEQHEMGASEEPTTPRRRMR